MRLHSLRSLVLVVLGLGLTSLAVSAQSGLVISQVYGGGGNTGGLVLFLRAARRADSHFKSLEEPFDASWKTDVGGGVDTNSGLIGFGRRSSV